MIAGAHGPVARRPFSAVQAAQVAQPRPFQGLIEVRILSTVISNEFLRLLELRGVSSAGMANVE